MSEGTAAALSAVLVFLFGVMQWRAQRRSELETRRIEAKKPFLERQLQLYTEATRVVSVIATSESAEARQEATKRFWELYWGELAMVENLDVEKAMESFGDALKNGAPADTLERRSLVVAHACRTSLDSAWGIRAWTEGHQSPLSPEPTDLTVTTESAG
jgi:hypothetical protein